MACSMDHLTLGPTPCGESCAQVGSPNYSTRMRKETSVYIHQLMRQFWGGKPEVVLDEDVYLQTKAFPHDFGTYHEVCIVFNTSIPEAVEFAYHIENNVPENWDEISREELGILPEDNE